MYNINEDFELTDKGIDLQAAQKAWPDVFYKGVNVWSFYCDDEVMDKIETTLRCGLGLEDEQGEHWQETYLGYSPSTQIFYCGFDVWMPDYEEEEGEEYNPMSSGLVSFKIEGGKVERVTFEYHVDDKFYNGGLTYFRGYYEDLVDLRLD